MADYIPTTDANFQNWAANFVAYVSAHVADLGLVLGDPLPVGAAVTAFSDALTAQIAAQTTAAAAVQAKRDARDEAESLIRALVRRLQASASVSDEERAAMGITVPGASAPTGEGGLAEPLLLDPDFSERGRCTIHFGVNPSNEHLNARPAGVRGAKLWFALGGVPALESGWQWLADDTNSPYLHVLAISTPTTLAYRAQYFDNQMELGAFCDPVVVTVTP